MPDADGRLAPRAGPQLDVDTNESAVARWVYEHHHAAGLGTTTLPGARALYVPLVAPRGPVGVLGIRPLAADEFDTPERLHELETFANQTALAIERARLAEEAQGAQVQAEAERLRNSLLSSAAAPTADPLTAISGAVSTVLDTARGRRGASRAAGLGARGGRAAWSTGQ